ncbi:MAG: energy transducer TonB [Novosphingobium sp.]|nr:energy transducer TonB [Novosphingobium sp.]
MNKLFRTSMALAVVLAAVPAFAAATVFIPASMMDRSAVVCVKVTAKGTVKDAFVVRSTGNSQADADMIEWIRKVPWPKASKGDPTRNQWQPIPVAMGKAEAPELPDSCAPPRA